MKGDIGRRHFLRVSAGAATAAILTHWWPAHLVLADGPPPVPLPGGLTKAELAELLGLPPERVRRGEESAPAHISGGPGRDPSSIFHFDGQVGIALFNGTGTDDTGATVPYLLADMRFMQGKYYGTNGQQYTGTFVFI